MDNYDNIIPYHLLRNWSKCEGDIWPCTTHSGRKLHWLSIK